MSRVSKFPRAALRCKGPGIAFPFLGLSFLAALAQGNCTEVGQPCVFPFIYEGMAYSECIITKAKPWCGTVPDCVDCGGAPGSGWGFCAPCPAFRRLPAGNESASAGLSPSTKAQCEIPWQNYGVHTAVAAQCDKLPGWEESKGTFTQGGSNCEVDLVTGAMTCEQSGSCEGGKKYEQALKSVVKTMVYNCEGRCKGSLVIQCCNKCQELQGLAKAGTFVAADIVECLGCTFEEQQLILADVVGCTVHQGAFECATQGFCDVGTPDVQVTENSYTCGIIPCDKCKDNDKGAQLHSACCAECLKSMCQSPTGRIACEGCASPYSSTVSDRSGAVVSGRTPAVVFGFVVLLAVLFDF